MDDLEVGSYTLQCIGPVVGSIHLSPRRMGTVG